jgi:HAD superfamily hydrolase (TIGR01509 family)
MNTRFDPDRVRAILFDLDGTLANTDDAYVERLARLIRILNRKSSANTLARRLVMSAETPTNALINLFDRLSLDELFRPAFAVLHKLRGENPPNHIQLIPGVQDTLHSLAACFPLGLVTSREQRSTFDILHSTGIGAHFTCVATARTCRRSKPHPSPVLWAAAQIGVSPSACLMVGDTTVDIRAGIAASAQTIGVLCGFGERAELERAGGHLIINTPCNLVDILIRETNP